MWSGFLCTKQSYPVCAFMLHPAAHEVSVGLLIIHANPLHHSIIWKSSLQIFFFNLQMEQSGKGQTYLIISNIWAETHFRISSHSCYTYRRLKLVSKISVFMQSFETCKNGDQYTNTKFQIYPWDCIGLIRIIMKKGTHLIKCSC